MAPMNNPAKDNWYLYLIRYHNNYLYTGITTDLQRRLAQHLAGTGARTLRGKKDLQLVFSAHAGNRSQAQQLEYYIKRLSKANKERLIIGALTLEHLPLKLNLSKR